MGAFHSLQRALRAVVCGALLPALAVAAREPGGAAFEPAEGFVAQSWQVEDGLPQGSVLCLAQSRDGDLWFGTQNGLVRFDGLTLRVFDRRTHPALRSNFTSALVEDARGVLWIGTSRGLTRLEDGRFTSVRLGRETKISALLPDGDDLWVASLDGLARVTRDGEVTWLAPPAGDPRLARVRSLALAPDGALWAGTAGGAVRLARDGTTRVFDRRQGLPHDDVQALAFDARGRLWAGTYDGPPVHLEAGGRRFARAHASWPGGSIRALLVDRQGRVWAGTRVGLALLDEHGAHTWGVGSGLTDDHVLSLFEDREGSLWIGTERAGLNRFKRPQLRTYTARDGLPEDTVLAVMESRRGDVWLGTWRGLTRLRAGAARTWDRRSGLAADDVIALAEARDGGLWVGHMHAGVSRVTGERAEALPLLEPGEPALALHEDASGALWIGTNRGLIRHAQGHLTRFGPEQGLPGDATVYHILPARAGGLLLGTGGGLARLRDGRIERVQPVIGALAEAVMALHEDADGTLWIASFGGGLGRLRDGRLTTYTERDGLLDDTLYSLLDDGQGGLWMSSNRGPSRLARADLRAFDAGRVRHLTPTSYGRGDGLRRVECNGGSQPVGWRARDGRLWFATVGGAAVIDPRHLPSAPAAPQARLLKVLVDREALNLSLRSGVSAGPSRGDVEVHYSASTLAAPEKVRFRYRLDGFDDDWREAGARRVATYTNVPPGRYRFEVQARSGDGPWSLTPARFELTLRPQFHQTAWFRALPVLVVGLGAWGLHQRRRRRVAADTAVLAERHRLACELHDGLAQGLSGLMRQIEAAQLDWPGAPPEVAERLGRARELARSSLADARASVRALRPPELAGSHLAEGLAAAAHQLVAGSGVRLEVEVSGTPRALPRETEQHLFRTGQEALSNAVRHAGASVIRLRVAFGRRSVRVSVHDDGRGLGAPGSADSGGFGIGGMRERMRLAGGKLRLVSRPGRGTEVAAVVPLGGLWPEARV